MTKRQVLLIGSLLAAAVLVAVLLLMPAGRNAAESTGRIVGGDRPATETPDRRHRGTVAGNSTVRPRETAATPSPTATPAPAVAATQTAIVAAGGDKATTMTAAQQARLEQMAPGTTALLAATEELQANLAAARDAAAREAALKALAEADARAAAHSATAPPTEEDDPSKPGYVIAGAVLRGEKPVQGAVLYLHAPNTSAPLSRSTNSNGQYRFSGLTEGEHMLLLVTPATPRNSRRVLLTEGQNRLTEDFLVPELPPVKGRTVEATTGDPVPGAHIEVRRGTSILGSLQADAKGTFTLFPLDAGSYLLRATAAGYLPGEKSFTVNALEASQDVVVELARSAEFVGEVIGDGGPVAGATAGLFGAAVYGDPLAAQGSRTTDGSGRFRMAVPPEVGNQSFRGAAWAAGYVPGYSAPVSVETLPRNGVAMPILLSRGGTIVGRVVDKAGEPVEGAVVTVATGFATTAGVFQRYGIAYPRTTTDGEGRFTLSAVEPGPTTLDISAETYVALRHPVTVVAGRQDIGDVTLESTDEPKAGRVMGMVMDEQGRPLAGHGIYLDGVRKQKHYETTTTSQGTFSLDNVEDDQYILFTAGSMLRGDLFVTMDQTFPFVKPGEPSIYLLYDYGQSIRLRVVDNGGNPVRNFTVGVIVRWQGATGYGGRPEAYGASWQRAFQTSDGRAVLDNLLAGRVEQLTIKAEGVSKSLTGLALGVGESLDLGDVRLDLGADVDGVVVSAVNGAAVAGARVQAVAPQGAPLSHPLASLPPEAVTDSGGAFLLRGVPACQMDLIVTKPGWQPVRQRGLQVESNVALRLGEIRLAPAAVLAGSVVDTEGNPLANVRVETTGGMLLVTDRTGRYYTDTAVPGATTLRFTLAGFVTEQRQVAIAETGTTQVDVTLTRSGN